MLLIDEIDKTDQEFEAMLLEVLSDFQISIPELGVIEARTHPIVVLTSNNSRELTEALKRRCLYLWLDYPDVEREMEIVRLHAPELDESSPAGWSRSSTWSAQLDLKKPPSIAESIDWARALLLLGADDIDREIFEQTMSIIVKHRTDIDLVAERVGVGSASRASSDRARPVPDTDALAPGLATQPSRLLRGASRPRASPSAPRRSSTRSRRSTRCRGPSPRDFREALAATVAKSQEDRRVFELLFDRYFFRAAEAEALEQGIREERRYEGGERLDLDELREAIRQAIAEGNDGEMRDLARLAIAAFGRQGEGSGVVGVDVQRIRRTLGLQARSRDRRRRAGAAARPRADPASSSGTCAASSSGR